MLDVDYFHKCYSALRDQLSSLRLPNFDYIDLSGVFDTFTDEDEIFLDSYHFGDRGNEIIAKAVLKNIAPIMRSKEFSTATQNINFSNQLSDNP